MAHLPNLSYDNLRELMGTRSRKNVGYATAATWEPRIRQFTIWHHNSAIAVIRRNRVEVSNAGWSSVTTADRMSSALRDNSCGVSVGITKGEMVFRDRASWNEYPVPHNRFVSFNSGK